MNMVKNINWLKILMGIKKYYLCEYSSKPFSTGKSLDIEFNNLEECKEYLSTL